MDGWMDGEQRVGGAEPFVFGAVQFPWTWFLIFLNAPLLSPVSLNKCLDSRFFSQLLKIIHGCTDGLR